MIVEEKSGSVSRVKWVGTVLNHNSTLYGTSTILFTYYVNQFTLGNFEVSLYIYRSFM